MIKELLINKKSSIIDSWVKSIVETYPLEASKFLRLQKNRFANPIGYAISDSAEKIFDEIVNDNNIDKIISSLNDLIRIRAVQDFSPSKAAGFIFPLKKFVRDEIGQEITSGNNLKEFMDLESRIDSVALTAFDLYMEAREKVFQIRVNELKSKLMYDGKTNMME
jgi:RsbT co-antagonist protein rsbRD N-terminal domain